MVPSPYFPTSLSGRVFYRGGSDVDNELAALKAKLKSNKEGLIRIVEGWYEKH